MRWLHYLVFLMVSASVTVRAAERCDMHADGRGITLRVGGKTLTASWPDGGYELAYVAMMREQERMGPPPLRRFALPEAGHELVAIGGSDMLMLETNPWDQVGAAVALYAVSCSGEPALARVPTPPLDFRYALRIQDGATLIVPSATGLFRFDTATRMAHELTRAPLVADCMDEGATVQAVDGALGLGPRRGLVRFGRVTPCGWNRSGAPYQVDVATGVVEALGPVPSAPLVTSAGELLAGLPAHVPEGQGGYFRSRDAGLTWTREVMVGATPDDDLEGFDVDQLVIAAGVTWARSRLLPHPMGTRGGRLAFSLDAGARWHVVDAPPVAALIIERDGAVVIDPRNPDGGAPLDPETWLRSTDRGATWEPTATPAKRPPSDPYDAWAPPNVRLAAPPKGLLVPSLGYFGQRVTVEDTRGARWEVALSDGGVFRRAAGKPWARVLPAHPL